MYILSHLPRNCGERKKEKQKLFPLPLLSITSLQSRTFLVQNRRSVCSQLVIHHIDLHLLARLESRQSDIRTSGTPSTTGQHDLYFSLRFESDSIPESVTQIAVSTRGSFAFYREIYLGQIISGEPNTLGGLLLGRRQSFVCGTTLFLIFLLNLLLQAAGTVFASSPALSRLRTTFSSCRIAGQLTHP